MLEWAGEPELPASITDGKSAKSQAESTQGIIIVDSFALVSSLHWHEKSRSLQPTSGAIDR